jgi:hypothetical protein
MKGHVPNCEPYGERAAMCGRCACCMAFANSPLAYLSTRPEPRGPPCEDCEGSGLMSSGHMNDPRSSDVDCSSCDGSGLRCEDCRHSKHGLCSECGLAQVEAFYE